MYNDEYENAVLYDLSISQFRKNVNKNTNQILSPIKVRVS